MNDKSKYLMYRYLIPVLIFVITWLILQYFFPDMIVGKKGFFAALITYLFMPKIKKINFLSGQNIQIKWFIFGKVILLNIDKK